MSITIDWQRPIPTLAVAVRSYKERLIGAIARVCEIVALRIEADAKANATWIDRTGNARQGLTARLIRNGTIFTIVLFHVMDYGKWLELRFDGRYAIIMKTLMAHYPRLMRMILAVIR